MVSPAERCGLEAFSGISVHMCVGVCVCLRGKNKYGVRRQPVVSPSCVPKKCFLYPAVHLNS